MGLTPNKVWIGLQPKFGQRWNPISLSPPGSLPNEERLLSSIPMKIGLHCQTGDTCYRLPTPDVSYGNIFFLLNHNASKAAPYLLKLIGNSSCWQQAANKLDHAGQWASQELDHAIGRKTIIVNQNLDLSRHEIFIALILKDSFDEHSCSSPEKPLLSRPGNAPICSLLPGATEK